MRFDLLDEPSLPRPVRRGLDLAAVLAVLMVAVWFWPVDAQPSEVQLSGVPWWGSTRDLMLEGPDAGEWARNIRLLEQGRLAELDHHRLPSWMVMVAAVMKAGPDVVMAGHIVNRLLFAALGLACFGIGRLRGGRMVGLLAAALAMGLPHVLSSSQRFGIDMAVSAMIPVLMLSALATTRLFWLGLPTGLLAGLVAGLHYTTPPYLLPPLVLLLLQGQGWKGRLGAVLLYLVGAAVSVWLLLFIYPVPSWTMFLNDIANGISPAPPGGGSPAALDTALAGLRADLFGHAGTAVANAVHALRVATLPWAAQLALPWLGVLGLALLPPRSGSGSWARSLLLRTDLAAGLALLCCLAPLPVLTGVGAPERYGNNFLPIVAVLIARGAGSLFLTVDALVRAGWQRWPRGPLLFLSLLPFFWAALIARSGLRFMAPPQASEIGSMMLAEALGRRFPAGTGIASPMREPLVIADMEFCPLRVCPTEASEDHFQRCVRVMAQECAGEGPIGYVWASASHFYDPNAKRAEMDRWVAERWPVAEELRHGDFSAKIYLIDRPALREGEDPLQGLPHPGQRPDGSVPPPPGGTGR